MSTIGDALYSTAGIESHRDIGTHRDKAKTNEINLICEKCKSFHFWLPKKSTTWRCYKCKPPSTQSIVERTNRSEPPNSLAGDQQPEPLTTWGPWLIAHGRPACPHCSGAWISETQTNQGNGVLMQCWSCKRTIDKLLEPPQTSIAKSIGIHG